MSWVDYSIDTDFPIQNLPYGVFKRKNTNDVPSIGVAIGDFVLDIKGAVAHGLLSSLPSNAQESLKEVLVLGFESKYLFFRFYF
jgi:fumarylacetoacetase